MTRENISERIAHLTPLLVKRLYEEQHDVQKAPYANALRAVIDIASMRRHSVEEDCWYTCPAATETKDGGETCRTDWADVPHEERPCECGRDRDLLRFLEAVLSAFPDLEATE